MPSDSSTLQTSRTNITTLIRAQFEGIGSRLKRIFAYILPSIAIFYLPSEFEESETVSALLRKRQAMHESTPALSMFCIDSYHWDRVSFKILDMGVSKKGNWFVIVYNWLMNGRSFRLNSVYRRSTPRELVSESLAELTLWRTAKYVNHSQWRLYMARYGDRGFRPVLPKCFWVVKISTSCCLSVSGGNFDHKNIKELKTDLYFDNLQYFLIIFTNLFCSAIILPFFDVIFLYFY